MKKSTYIFLAALCLAACNKNINPSDRNGADPITPFQELNQGDDKPGSHAGQTASSMLTLVGGSYVRLDKSVTQCDLPVYPHFTKTEEGDYLMFYHRGSYTPSTDKYSWGGQSCFYMRSPDGFNWSFEKEIFPVAKNVQGHYDNVITRYYAGAHPLRMSNGDIIVFASYHGTTDMRHNIKDNGLAYRISHDGGRTWTQEARLTVGTCWEPWPLQLSDGRVVVYYTDSTPYIENVWPSDIISSGVSYVYSDDFGTTWKPDDLLNDHLWAFRKVRDEKGGIKAYTDQMAGAIQLVGSRRQVICAESNYAPCTSTTTEYWVDFGYSDEDGNWMPCNADNELPSDRVNKVFRGSAPTIDQFVSGETVATYNYSRNGSNFYYYHMGDENARIWGPKMEVFSGESPIGYGFWGSTLCDGHVMLAGVGGSGGSRGTGFPMQAGMFYLNHNITASQHKVDVDGHNQDWAKTDQALFVGSRSMLHATLRCSRSADMVYFLAEVDGSECSPSDYISVYLTSVDSDSLKEGDICAKVLCDGTSSLSEYKPGWFRQDTQMLSSSATGNGYYYVEFGLPTSSVPVKDGRLKVNFAVGDSNDGVQSIYPVTSTNTENWIQISF